MPHGRLLLFALLMWTAGIISAHAAELLMYRSAGCAWCAAWDREIGPIYPKTEIGQRLPIRFLYLEHEEEPKIALAAPIRFTPTFVLAETGRELGRIEGYPGQDFFWGLVERLAQRLNR